MKSILTIISITLILFSCQEKGYDLKVKSIDPILIVDARVESHTQKAKVKLTKSTDFLGDNPEKYENDASVFLSVNGGSEVELVFLDSGRYELQNVIVDEGTTYKLRIVDGQNEYKAETKMLNIIPVDFFPISEALSFGKESKDTFTYYAFDMLVNLDFSEVDYFITETNVTYNPNPDLFFGEDAYLSWSDEPYDANPAFFPYYVSDFPEFTKVNVRFSHINKENYDFYESLGDVADQSPSSIAPSNPLSNISNGAIGSFGAFATFDTTITMTF